jgi:radical SAM superfamily enzyme YgiQ (UPF0313 family)
MTDVLFGQSYYLKFDPKLQKAMQPYPPLGTLYAAAVVRRAGYDVALFDAMLADSTAEWEAALDQYQPRVAILYEDNFNYLSKMSLLRMREAAFAMIAAARSRGCIVLVAGADMTDHPEKYLEHGADIVITGEGEETLLDLLAALIPTPDKPTSPNSAVRTPYMASSALKSPSPDSQNDSSENSVISPPLPDDGTKPRSDGEGLGVRAKLVSIPGIAYYAADKSPSPLEGEGDLGGEGTLSRPLYPYKCKSPTRQILPLRSSITSALSGPQLSRA